MATATSTDMQLLATDSTFGNRVQALLTVYCTLTLPSTVPAASPGAIATLQQEKNYAATVMNNLTTMKFQFIWAAACNQIVANDATAGGALTGANLAASAALCTDTHISNAISAAFPTFIAGI